MKEANVIPFRSILIVQISALVMYSLIAYLSWLAVPSNTLMLDVVIVRILEVLSQWLFSGILIIFIEWCRISGKTKILFWVSLLPLIYLAALGASLTTTFLMDIVNIELSRPRLSSTYFRFALYYIVPIVFALVAYGFVAYYYIAGYEKEKTQKAQLLLQQAKWQMLRYQVNPHFLFNALNTIRSMLKKDQEDARRVVTELAEYFRYSLDDNPEGQTELSKELAAVKNYLEIQRLRFESKIDYEIISENGIDNIKIPIFGLQTLVENAVKYGMKTSDIPLKIKLECTRKAGFLFLDVTNTGRIHNNSANENHSSDGTETGLKNLRDRLEVLYHGLASFELSEDGEKVLASLKLPLNYGHENLEGNNNR